MLGWLAQLLGGNVLGRILDTVDKKFDNETERERIKSEVTRSYVTAETDRLKIAATLTASDKWMSAGRALFIVPTGVYYSAIIADSLWQFDWNVAALPAPYDAWGAAIVTALFGLDTVRRIVRG